MHFSAIHPLHSFLSPYLLSLSFQFTPPPIPNPSPHLTLHALSFTPPPIPNPSPHLTLHALTLHPTSHPTLSIHHSLTPHNPSVFSLSSCVIQYPPHVPHLPPPLPPQVLFVMTSGIQRRTHSLFDHFQYHPLGEHLSSVLMRIYIGKCLCYKRDEYIFPQTLYVRSYGTWDTKLTQYTHTYICVS